MQFQVLARIHYINLTSDDIYWMGRIKPSCPTLTNSFSVRDTTNEGARASSPQQKRKRFSKVQERRRKRCVRWSHILVQRSTTDYSHRKKKEKQNKKLQMAEQLALRLRGPGRGMVSTSDRPSTVYHPRNHARHQDEKTEEQETIISATTTTAKRSGVDECTLTQHDGRQRSQRHDKDALKRGGLHWEYRKRAGGKF